MEMLPVLVAVIAAVVMIAAVHVWYAWGVAQVLAAQGVDSWRAWVPLLNESELFRLGRIEPVKAVLLLVPFVSVYALVLKVIAAHRIGARYGRGAGTTALAVVLPPVWATVLSGAQPLAPDAAADADADDADEAAAALLGGRPATALAAAAVPAPPAAEVPPAALPEVVAAQATPAAPAPGATGAHPISSVPLSPLPTVAPSPTAAPAATPAAAPVAAPAASPSPAASPASTASASPAAVEPEPAPADEHTHLVRQRTRRRGSWDIELPGGEVVSATARILVLGRKPGGGDPAVQYITVDDATRTVSKEHARIEWAGDGWTITDLGSTNGVALVADDGTEQRLTAGTPAPLFGRFLLGDAKLELRATPAG